MKRLYTFMLSAAIAVAASAAIPVSKAPARLIPSAATEVVSPLVGGLHFQVAEPGEPLAASVATNKTVERTEFKRLEGGQIKRVAKAPRKADGTGSKYDGTYTLTAGEWYLQNQSQSSVPVEVELTVADGIVTMSNDDYLVSDIMALFDEENGKMTFVNYYLGSNSAHAISFMPFSWNSGIQFGSYSVTFDEETQSFNMPADHGISWAAFDIANIDFAKAFDADSVIGYYDIFDVEGLVKNASGEEPEQPETWTSIGMGEWYEGLLTIFSDIEEGQHWSVEIEESDKTPGVYRMKPYAVEGNPIAQLMGSTDNTTEVIVNATDPNKVYTDGQFSPYNLRTFCGLNKENNFNADAYGALVDGVITFPAKSFAYNNNGSWYYVSKEGFKIALPGADVKDYTLKATADHICAATDENIVNLTVGADIAAIKAFMIKGKYDTSYGTNAQIVAASGNDIEIGDSFTISNPEEGGLYSIMVVGLNAEGSVVANTTTYQVVDAEKDADWAVVPNTKAIFTEGFLSGLFSNVDPEDFEVVLEENVNTPGRFRFEAPYAKHSINWDLADHSHKHYIYVNATNPEKAYVEISALGVADSGFGSIYGYSFPGLYAGTDTFYDLEASVFGTYADGKIVTPALASSNKYPNNGNYTASFTLAIEKTEPVETWTSVGEGEWREGLLHAAAPFFFPAGLSWKVEVEESEATPGVYRIKPYAVENTISETITYDIDEETVVYINATDPNKVYTTAESNFYPYEMSKFIGNNPENGQEGAVYGTLKNGVISFPEGAFILDDEYEGTRVLEEGSSFKVILPGATSEVERIEMGAIVGEVGEYIKVRPEVIVTDETLPAPAITWSSTNPEVAAVDEDGKVWFNAAGSATVIAECGGVEYTVPFEVEAVLARALNVFPVEAVGGKGHSLCLLAIHEPDNTTDKSVTWESEDPNVASVDETGRVELISAGTTKITATSGEHTASCSITVDDTINLTEIASTGVAIDIVEDGIVVRHAEEGASIAVYTIEGQVINGAVASGNETHIALTAGIYIVKVSPDTVAKVLIK